MTSLRRTLTLLALLLGTLWIALPGLAEAKSVRAEKSTLEEADGRWKLKLTIDYGSVPDINYVPMIFDFEPVMLYERALTDESPEKPIVNKKPLQNMKHINESMEVGFSDHNGKGFKVTKFDFSIRRDRGFEAGEYKLIVKLADTGKAIGQPLRVVLNGDNVIVDRRAISFVGEKSGGKKKEKAPPPPEGSESAPPADGPAVDAPSGEGAAEGEPPPSVEPKQGGCGCVVAGQPGATGAWALALLGLLALGARRRLSEPASARRRLSEPASARRRLS